MGSGAEIYTYASINRDEVIETKQNLFSDMIKTISLLIYYFSDNKNLIPAIKYIYNYYLEFIGDLNREHDLYDKIMDYLASLDDIETFDDESILDDLYSIFDEIENTIDYRIMLYGDFASHINQIFEYGVLTSSNYLYPNYISYMDERKKQSLLALIPKITPDVNQVNK